MTELNAGREFWELRTSAVFAGRDVPHGDGHAVLVLPGLFGNDLYLGTMNQWLRRIGYQPLASRILWNVGCADRLVDDVDQHVARQLARLDPERQFSIVGHSRGGLLAKALSAKHGRRIRHLILVGSPLGGMLAAGPGGLQAFEQYMRGDGESPRNTVYQMSRRMVQLLDPECSVPSCDCAYMQGLFDAPDPQTRLTAIFSTDDAIVPAAIAQVHGITNHAVRGSHSGLMFNAEVYKLIANALQT
ncbi:MAG: alpha/beta hydrolase [Pseudomonadota bacterium]